MLTDSFLVIIGSTDLPWAVPWYRTWTVHDENQLRIDHRPVRLEMRHKRVHGCVLAGWVRVLLHFYVAFRIVSNFNFDDQIAIERLLGAVKSDGRFLGSQTIDGQGVRGGSDGLNRVDGLDMAG